MPVFVLHDDRPVFPEPSSARPDGLLALGGNLEPETLVSAYRRGIFPWYSEDQPLLWWSPDPRLVLEPGELRVSRSLSKSLRSKFPRIGLNRAFGEVIGACTEPRKNSPGTWITETMKNAYIALHKAGFAFSVEAYDDGGALAGGLYGVRIGRMVFGESMFSKRSDASKAALFHLCAHMRRHGLALLDCQVESGHLRRLGAKPMPRAQFLEQNARLCRQPPGPDLWRAQWLPCPAEQQRQQQDRRQGNRR